MCLFSFDVESDFRGGFIHHALVGFVVLSVAAPAFAEDKEAPSAEEVIGHLPEEQQQAV